MRKITELEGVCLSIINKHQPCTAYRVRSELKQAPSSHWRGSAGSVYPMLARLENEQFLTSKVDSRDGRGRQELRTTANGRAAIRAWIMTGAEQDLISSVTDPLRSRLFFLDVLKAKQRIQFLDKLIFEVQCYLGETKSHLAARPIADDPYEHLGSLGAVKITEARLSWLVTVRKRLQEG